jgi:hypothetical protein
VANSSGVIGKKTQIGPIPVMPGRTIHSGAGGVALVAGLARAQSKQGTASPETTVMILANATRPKDLDSEGVTCRIATSGQAMTCSFQQVLLVPGRDDPETCAITTNRYEENFRLAGVARPKLESDSRRCSGSPSASASFASRPKSFAAVTNADGCGSPIYRPAKNH